ncbi:hypothetical protein [Dentiradicibacter hellwigii]|uniref:Uncharacterized protein n=1 Tax=Dentiradicibacter hellwigii TaxID=3149053 RepID=A0ABV4UC60_9RHOO
MTLEIFTASAAGLAAAFFTAATFFTLFTAADFATALVAAGFLAGTAAFLEILETGLEVWVFFAEEALADVAIFHSMTVVEQKGFYKRIFKHLGAYTAAQYTSTQ